MRDIVQVVPDTAWDASGDGAPTHDVESVIEDGGVLVLPQLRFELSPDEHQLLDPGVADGKAKNVSLRGSSDDVRGANPAHIDATRALMRRYRAQSMALVERLFPHYRGHLQCGNTSYRPMPIEGRVTSWRKDDTRLHVDAFPSNPIHGRRLLRVFHNLHPRGEPRRWRVGEPFETFAARYLPAISRPLPGSPALLHALRVTKSRRSAYDHYMLQLHDRVKADAAYQRDAPQRRIDLAPGTTWVVYSDQVLHAAMGGQFLIEQTFYLEPSALKNPASAPVAVLQKLLGRPLL
ncbi:MAG: Kdo hydroxylase family protein [Burkholderiaceae bacterium]|nr:Kdo hydroxylase family protein [Burkholderiaceae bacterium]